MISRDNTVKTEWQVSKINIPSHGLTVRELIDKLRKMKQDSKVVLYRPNGETFAAIQVIQDSPNKVAIF